MRRSACASRTGLSLSVIGLLLTALAVSGCFGGGGGSGRLGTIKGCVSELDLTTELRAVGSIIGAGPGVEEATVTLVGTSKVATTHSVGEFTFSGVGTGTYDVLITKKDWPSVMAYDVKVESGKTTELALRMVKPGPVLLLPAQDAEPPTVEIDCKSVVSGMELVEITASDNRSPVEYVFLLVDNTVGQVWDYGDSTSVRETCSWDTRPADTEGGWDDGEHVIAAMAMDACGNIGYRSITVTVDNGPEVGSVPGAPTDVTALAATVHYSVFDLLEEASGGISQIGATALDVAKKVRSGMARPGTRSTPAGSDAVLACILSWQSEDDPATLGGFKIYRDGAIAGQFPVFAEGVSYPLPQTDDPMISGQWVDTSPSLTVGDELEYRVSAYNRAGEGPRSAAARTTALTPLRAVQGLDIAGGDWDVPTFSWDPLQQGAELYLVTVIDADADSETQGQAMWQGYTPRDETSVEYGDPDRTVPGTTTTGLVPGHQYAWFVMAISSTPDPLVLLEDPGSGPPEAISVSASEPQGLYTPAG